MKNILTVKEKTIYSLEVEKSKFIAIAYPLNDIAELDLYLNETKKEYPKARHYCYGLTFDGTVKYSDDGEPQGTAGKPILGQLNNLNLTNTLVIVVRYFGGTLLGSGRLLRTYLKSATEVLNEAKKVELIEMIKFRVGLEIDFYQTFINYLKRMGFIVINTVFNDKIIVDFLTPKEFNDDLTSLYYGKLDLIGKINYVYRKDVE